MKVKSILRSSREDQTLPAYFPGWFEERFGTHFSQISVDTTLKLKSAAKDVARAMRKRCVACGHTYESPNPVHECGTCGGNRVIGYVPADVEELTKRFLMPPQGITDYAFVMGYSAEDAWVQGSSVPGHEGTDEALLTYIERYPEDWEIVKKSLGLARQKGRHACAFVIANKPIANFIPLTSVGGVSVTSFTAPAVEAVGGLKMDFLVINSLRDIQDCLRLVQERTPFGRQTKDLIVNGRRVAPQRLVPDPKTNTLVDIWDLPEDQDVFADVSAGRTETVFQFNTPGAVQWLVHFNYVRPDGLTAIRSVEDMAAFTALDRPGPLNVLVSNPEWVGAPTDDGAKHNMLVEFARRARGAAPSPDVLPALEELVPETYGVMTYQEQLQRVYQSLTGCTGSEAEDFRTNVSKKKKKLVDAAYPGFMERAGAKIGAENAQKLWDFIKEWAQYGFNKSHAVCYAVIGYACAWLKHHYPLEWWCAVLRNATKDEINEKFWRHCGKHVALPDVKLSGPNWQIEGDRVRAPTSLLHGVGEKAHLQLCQYAPYADIDAFATSIVNHRAEGTVPSVSRRKHPKTGEVKEIPTVTLGRSAIQRKIVYTLIVAGAMDSLFPQDATVEECLQLFDTAMLKALSLKMDEQTDPETKKKWKAAYKDYEKKAVGNYLTLDSLGRYQLRKSILPAYGTDLRVILRHLEMPAFLKLYDGRRMRYSWTGWNHAERRTTTQEDPVVGVDKLEALNTTTRLPEGGYRCAVIAYLEEKRTFRYGENKSKEAMELTIEVGGGKYKFAHWPDRDGALPDVVRDLKPGSIIAALLVRNRADKPFSVRQLSVIRDAINTKVEETEETDEQQES